MTRAGARLLADGREAEIYDIGRGRVLRRYKAGGHPEREALVMEHARAHGFPAPRVDEVRPDGLVLERLDGDDMGSDLRRRPWRLRAHARTLAQLHRLLHAIPAPPTLEAAGQGGALVHLDLHPLNVLVTGRGPVVIDWTNARRGEPALDVALTWVILATSGALPGRAFLRAFLPAFDRAAIAAALPAAAERRLADPNVRDDEREAVRRLLARERRAHARR